MMKPFKRRKGSVVAGFAVLIALFVVTLHASSSPYQGNHSQRVNSHIPSNGQGLYESCAPRKGPQCLDRLKQMAAGGFSFVLNYDQLSGNAEQQLAYARQAHSLDMEVIWAIKSHDFWDGTDLIGKYSDLATTCNCSDNDGFIRYFVNLVKNLPATWGYYIGDEVSPNDHDKLKTFSDLVKQIDPYHPRLFISCSQCNQNAKLNPPYVASLIPMVDTSDVVGTDWYPVGSGGYSIAETSKVARNVQSVADLYDKQSAIVLQAFNWSEYPSSFHPCSPYPLCEPFPTEAQMQQMRTLTLQNSHPHLILWYSYFDILRSDNPARHWADLVAAANATISGSSTGILQQIYGATACTEGKNQLWIESSAGIECILRRSAA